MVGDKDRKEPKSFVSETRSLLACRTVSGVKGCPLAAAETAVPLCLGCS